MDGPAAVEVVGTSGLVWDPDEARRLRRDARIVGCMVGGLAGHKQQNAVNGLPLLLSGDEVTLALQLGWARLSEQPKVGRAPEGEANSMQQAKPTGSGSDAQDASSEEAEAEEDEAAQEWRAALARPAAYAMPVRRAALGPAEQAACSSPQCAWAYPKTPEQALQFAVFKDLHSAGDSDAWKVDMSLAASLSVELVMQTGPRYFLTEGSKFGADLLAYPGDPMLFHAQFCVRILEAQQPLAPHLLASAARGSHAARKHLLLAAAGSGAGGKGGYVQYLTLAPEAGFGTAC